MARATQSRRSAPTGPTPAPSQPSGVWAVALYALVTLVYAYPALAGQFLVNTNSDQYIGGYPVRAFAAAWEKASRGIPQWNPYIFGGMPFIGSMNGDEFYPTALLRILLRPDVGMTWGFIIHVFLCGCFTFLFLRRAMRLGFFGSVAGGLAYMTGGNVAGLVSPGHDGKLFVATLLPLTLFFLHRGIRDGRRWAWGALAITVTLAFLSPHPQLFQYLLLASAAYALFLAFTAAESDVVLPRRVALQRLALALASVVLGTLGGAIQYLPLMEYTPWSPRSGGRGWDHAVSYSMPPEELINSYLPQFSGLLERYSGRNILHFHSEYLGAAVLVLATLAIGTRVVPRRVVWFWLGAFVVALLWALGGYTPFYHVVYALVPGTKYFRAPSTMLFFVSFCTAVLAAIGVERLLNGDVPVRRAIGWVVLGGVMLLLAATGALTSLASSFVPFPELVERVQANQAAVVIGAVRSLLAVGVVAWLAFDASKTRLPRLAMGWLLVAAIGLDLWSIVHRYWMFSPPAAQLYASDPVIDYLKHLPEPGRVWPQSIFPPQSRIRDPYLGAHGEGRADGFMVHGIRSIAGNHGNELGRYDMLTDWDTQDWPKAMLTSETLRALLNVQYVYTNDSVAPFAGAKLVAGPAVNVAGNRSYLFRIAERNPMAWVVPLAVNVQDSLALLTVLDRRFDPRRAAVLDPSSSLPARPVPSSLPDSILIGVKVTTMEPGHITLTLDQPAPAGATLIVSENYYPGWSASVDGATAPIGRADFVLIGVALKAGARSVELRFADAAYAKGKTITLVAIAAMLLMLAAGVVMDRRSHAAPDSR